jgi:hypothetical protein
LANAKRPARHRLPVEAFPIGAACLACCLPLFGGLFVTASGLVAGLGTAWLGAGPGRRDRHRGCRRRTFGRHPVVDAQSHGELFNLLCLLTSPEQSSSSAWLGWPRSAEAGSCGSGFVSHNLGR